MKQVLPITVLLVASVSFLLSLHDHPEPDAGKRADRLCRDLIAHKDNVEALSWLEQSRPGNERTLGEQDPASSLAIVRNLYDSGAQKVQAVGLERVPGVGETSNILCAELPEDKTKREKLFKIEARTASAEGFDPTPDQGQTYLFLFKFKLGFWQALRMIVGHRG
jgi:hypothetical protein